jgi:putative ABC transport system permease protein
MTTFLRDLGHGVRNLRKSPAFAVTCVVSLALGIGANVTIYSIVREMVLDDVSAQQPDRLARVAAEIPYGRYRDLRAAGVSKDLAFNIWLQDVSWDTGTHGEVAWQMITSANFFDVLGISAYRGQLYSDGDVGKSVVAVSYGFWQSRLNGDARIVGRELKLNGKLYTVTGVLPRDYRSILGRGISNWPIERGNLSPRFSTEHLLGTSSGKLTRLANK